jgi:2-hydroxy-4-carboxymuconate semialdehyde hemiacetal dehydrogenase
MWASAGPCHPDLGVPMDMNIGLRARDGTLATLALSFNNRGPFGGFYRYIGTENTYKAYRDVLTDYEDSQISLQGNGFEAQDSEFISAIRGMYRTKASFESCLPTMRLLDRLEKIMIAEPKR